MMNLSFKVCYISICFNLPFCVPLGQQHSAGLHTRLEKIWALLQYCYYGHLPLFSGDQSHSESSITQEQLSGGTCFLLISLFISIHSLAVTHHKVHVMTRPFCRKDFCLLTSSTLSTFGWFGSLGLCCGFCWGLMKPLKYGNWGYEEQIKCSTSS